MVLVRLVAYRAGYMHLKHSIENLVNGDSMTKNKKSEPNGSLFDYLEYTKLVFVVLDAWARTD
jgi:hypothetical protein